MAFEHHAAKPDEVISGCIIDNYPATTAVRNSEEFFHRQKLELFAGSAVVLSSAGAFCWMFLVTILLKPQ